jgi:AhpD family alkylhydroperoxidase
MTARTGSTGLAGGPRITPGDRHSAGTFAWGFAQLSGLLTRTTAPNLFLTMGRQPKLFRGWLRFAARLMPGGTLPRRESELVILRVAHLRQCAYEFDHHVRLGTRAGLSPADLERVLTGPAAHGWTPRERALLEAAQTIEFVLLVGHYEMLATFITTLRIDTDGHR